MNSNSYGAKATNLQILKDAGYNVPPFMAFSSQDLLNTSPEELATLAHQHLGKKSYAVRSSALVEDTKNSSMAGQFLTRLNIPPQELARAIQEVRNHGKHKLGSLEKFSLFVQEFVDPEYAGVMFTRNPSGGRESIIEYVQGSGEKLVAGQVQPKRFSFFRTQRKPTYPQPEFAELTHIALDVEQRFGFPQDIEWCIKDHRLFLVQSRPVTSLTRDDVKVQHFLDATLPQSSFYYAKTGVTEVAPRPTPLTFSLLQLLYADDGPVSQAYASLGITYADTHFLRVIAGEVFVDKERELRSILPSMTYLKKPDYSISFNGFSRLSTTLKNQGQLRRLKFDSEKLFTQLGGQFEEFPETQKIEQAVEYFLRDYSLIFIINLAAEYAVRSVQRMVTSKVPLAAALSMKTNNALRQVLNPPPELHGNTLEIFDASEFQSVLLGEPIGTYIPGLPDNKILEAQELQRLREYGRWLALQHITKIREIIEKSGHGAAENFYDILGKQKSTESEYDATSLPTSLPATLTDRPFAQETSAPLGVSEGKAQGVLVNLQSIRTTPGDKILFVEDLSPALADVAGDVRGVIACNGSMLSHFAIIAREMHLPVIVQIDKSKFTLGGKVTMDGATGNVTNSS